MSSLQQTRRLEKSAACPGGPALPGLPPQLLISQTESRFRKLHMHHGTTLLFLPLQMSYP